jgi:hypothetical protein
VRGFAERVRCRGAVTTVAHGSSGTCRAVGTTKSKVHGCANARLAFSPNAPAVPCDDSIANRKAKASTGVLTAMEAFEQPKDPLSVFLIESNTIVLKGDRPASICLLSF